MRCIAHFFVAVLCAGFAAGAAAQEIDRIEPPFWWTGFKETSLQLMVYGEGISDYTPAIDHDGVAIRGGA